jgi:glutamate dehydrogenase (NADP+)
MWLGSSFKVNDLGGKVVTISGPDGYIYDEEGISGDKIDFMLEMRARGDNRAEAYLENIQTQFSTKEKVFEVKVDIAIPCATQNELNEEDAKHLIANGVMCVTEAANAMYSRSDQVVLESESTLQEKQQMLEV